MSVNYQTVEVQIPAGGREIVTVVGAYCRVLTAAQPFEISFGSNASTEVIEQGLQVKTPGFDQVNLFNPNATPLTVLLAVSAAGVDDSRLSLPGALVISGVVDANVGAFSDLDDVTLPAGTAQQIVADDFNRLEVVIQNKTGAAMRIGGATVSATRGTELPNGAAITINSTTAVYGFSATGGPVTLAEVTR